MVTVEDILSEIDDYEQTVGAIIALGHIIIYDLRGNFKIGHKLITTSDNRVTKNVTITPDIVGQNTEYNLIGEVRKDLPMDQGLWLEEIKQVEKYDDDLTGWPLKDAKNHDLVLLTHHLRSSTLAEFVQEQIGKKGLTFNRLMAIVEFVRNRERRLFWDLKKVYGTFSNPQLEMMLKRGVGVPGSKIVEQLSSLKFYDAEPHVVYTMSLIWDHVLPEKGTVEKFREARGKKTVEIPFTIDEVITSLRNYFAPPDSAFPKREWIFHAMSTFEQLGYARKEEDKYTIQYHRTPQGRVLQDFAEQWLEKSKNAKITEFAAPTTTGSSSPKLDT